MKEKDWHAALAAEEAGGICLGNLEAILAAHGVDDVSDLGRFLYKYTDAGLWLSVRLHDGTWKHTGNLDGIDNGNVRALLVGSIVEGSDAEVYGREVDLLNDDAPAELEHEVEEVDAEACRLWEEANADGEG